MTDGASSVAKSSKAPVSTNDALPRVPAAPTGRTLGPRRGFADNDRFYRFTKFVVAGILRAASSLTLEGINLCPPPSAGPLILASSHHGYPDIPLLGSVLPRLPIFISKSEIEKWPVLGWVGARYGAIYLRRGEADRVAIREALAVIHDGQLLTIFPEGHRNKGVGLLRGQPGISLLAFRGKARIWPVAIEGTHHIFRGLRPKVTVRCGEPFDPLAVLGTDGLTIRDHQELADVVMRRIAALLPAGRRGYYE